MAIDVLGRDDLPFPGSLVNGCRKARKYGGAKKAGTEIAAPKPGQGRASARCSEPLTRRRCQTLGHSGKRCGFALTVMSNCGFSPPDLREFAPPLTALPEFQRLFPDERACATYLKRARWGRGFVCPHCETSGEPYRYATRPGVLCCRKCRRETRLTAGTVVERTHTPLSVWFWAAYLVASQRPGMSAIQFQRQLGLSRYETAFQILHKLRAAMVRPDQDRIGGKPEEHIEADETYVGGRTRGKGRGVHDMVIVAGAVEVRQRKERGSRNKRRTGRYAGRVRPAVAPDRSAKSLGDSLSVPLRPGPPSLPTTGAAMQSWASALQ